MTLARRAVHRHSLLATLVVAALVLSGCELLDAVTGVVSDDDTAEEQADEEPAEATEDPDDTTEDADAVDEEADTDADQEADEEEADEVVAVEAPCDAGDTNLDPALPDVATYVETATGDLTGDGQPDEVTTYGIGDDDNTVFMMRFSTASGFIAEVPLDDATTLTPPRPLGIAPIGGEREVAFVVERSGASGVSVGLWGLHDTPDFGCTPLPVSIPDHTTGRLFAVGGSVGQASGFGCADVNGDGAPELVVTEAQQADGDAYDWRESAWSWPGVGELQLVDDDTGTVDDLAELDGRFEVDCPGVDAP